MKAKIGLILLLSGSVWASSPSAQWTKLANHFSKVAKLALDNDWPVFKLGRETGPDLLKAEMRRLAQACEGLGTVQYHYSHDISLKEFRTRTLKNIIELVDEALEKEDQKPDALEEGLSQSLEKLLLLLAVTHRSIEHVVGYADCENAYRVDHWILSNRTKSFSISLGNSRN